jgi:hypothetical protein
VEGAVVHARVVTERDQAENPPFHRRRWLPLAVILAAQAAGTLAAFVHRAVTSDEALYIWAGHLELNHWMHGATEPQFAGYFSGDPVLWPPLAALPGNLLGARLLAMGCMLAATVLLYLTALRLGTRMQAIAAAAVFAVTGPVLYVGRLATFDALSLTLLALAAYIAVRFGRKRWLILAAAVMLLANAVKYASVLWDPVIVALAVLYRWTTWKAALSRGLMVVVPWVVGAAAFALARGSELRRGILLTTLTRHSGAYPAPQLLWQGLLLEAILLALAVLGVAVGRSRRESWALLAAALLAPAEQARIHDLTSLPKHVAFGAWFAAIPAGVGVAWLVRGGSRWISVQKGSRFAVAGVAVVAAAVFAAAGFYQGNEAGVQSPATYLIAALRKLPCPLHGKILVDASEAEHAWPLVAPHWWDFALAQVHNVGNTPVIGRNLRLIRAGDIGAAALSFKGKFARQDDLYRAALHATRRFRFVRTVQFSSGSGRYLVWERSRGACRA